MSYHISVQFLKCYFHSLFSEEFSALVRFFFNIGITFLVGWLVKSFIFSKIIIQSTATLLGTPC